MLCSYNWLKEYVQGLPPARVLADGLTMSGVEVESVTEVSSVVKGVVTGEVVSVGRHPNADRLSLCEVKTDKEAYSIVCGASNMKAGDKVALALPGAELPGGIRIKRSKIRGVESGGMMCSEVELGLKEAAEGIMILPEDTPLGVDLNALLGIADFMMEIGVTPNRADLLSIRGMAREASSVFPGASFRDKEISVDEPGAAALERITVTIEAGDACRRYMARVIEGVKVGPSPEYLAKRLLAHGVRPVNNVVDATNYVLLETGQPLHAFDLDRLRGRAIKVRFAEEGETIETIDNKIRRLSTSMPVIADAEGPVAVAGVMGGKHSEICGSTRDILLECAYFTPSYVRKTARGLGLSTDSSYRFERGVDINGIPGAIDLCAHLIKKIAGGGVRAGRVDAYQSRYEPAPIALRIGRAEAVLGIRLETAAVRDILMRLGMSVTEMGSGVFSITPPSYRADVKEEIDLIEEVVRLSGYTVVPAFSPVSRLSVILRSREARIRKSIAGALTGAGFFEVMNYSFISRKLLRIAGPEERRETAVLNPLSEDQAVMRDSLLPSLIETLRKNLLMKNERMSIFEIAPVFLPGEGKLPVERWRAAGLMYGSRWEDAWNRPKDPLDFYDVKGVVQRVFEAIGIAEPVKAEPIGEGDNGFFHPGKAALAVIGGNHAGAYGEMHPGLREKLELKGSVFLFDLDIKTLCSSANGLRPYMPLPKFPESSRDIAFIVDAEVAYQEIISAIERLDRKLVEKVELFDVYCGKGIPEGKVSMALRLIYRSPERTLKQAEVDEMNSGVAEELVRRFKAIIRGAAEGA